MMMNTVMCIAYFHTQKQHSLMYSTESLFHSHTQDCVNVGNTPQEQGQITCSWSFNDSGMGLFYFFEAASYSSTQRI